MTGSMWKKYAWLALLVAVLLTGYVAWRPGTPQQTADLADGCGMAASRDLRYPNREIEPSEMLQRERCGLPSRAVR